MLYKQNGKVTSVTVDMGMPTFSPETLPTTLKARALSKDGRSAAEAKALPDSAIIGVPIIAAGTEYKATCLAVGNPHCVIFSKFVDKEPVAKAGAEIECNAAFPQRTNVEFVRAVGTNELKMRTWERGNGETLACGTGASAAVVAAVLNGYCRLGEDITVKVRGGVLTVKYTGDTVYLTGGASLSFEGEVEI